MNNIKEFSQYVFEMKSDREIVRDLARHLSFDKDVVKYLNTSRAKRTIGWRDLLRDKLHGSNLDYINYITKNMVADYNPQITGYINIDDEGDFDELKADGTHKKRRGEDDEVEDRINDMEDRLEDVEDVLGIDPDDSDTVIKAGKALGLNPDFEKEEEPEEEPEEE